MLVITLLIQWKMLVGGFVFFQQIPFQNYNVPIPTRNKMLILTLSPSLWYIFSSTPCGNQCYPSSTKPEIKWVAHESKGDVNREQDKHIARSTLLKHIIYRGQDQISELLKQLAQSHLVRCSLFHLSNKLWVEFLQWARLLRWIQQNNQIHRRWSLA